MSQVFPALDCATEAALRESIKRFGVLMPVVVSAGPWEPGAVIDGHNRGRLAGELGAVFDTREISVTDADEASDLARTLNLDRRHLDAKQRREVVLALKADGHSTRAIAGAVGTSQSTVMNDLKTEQKFEQECSPEVVSDKGSAVPATVPDDIARQGGEQEPGTALLLPYPSSSTPGLVLQAVIDAGASGATDRELATAIGLPPQQALRARQTCLEDGWIVNAGLSRRVSQRGPAAIAWQASTDVADRLGLDRGWSKKQPRKKRSPPKNETEQQRRQREEREAIKAVDAEEPASAQFRKHMIRLQEWASWFSDLANLAEEEHCNDTHQRVLLVLLEDVVKNATGAQRVLRRNRPKDMHYYNLLGVTHDVETEVIQRAYRELAKQHHPDVNNGQTSQMFTEITEAYNTLREPVLRQSYDTNGRN